jgi:hypothetical protein
MRKRVVLAVTCVAAAALAGGTVAIASSDSEGGVTGPQADRAVRAALEATDGGTANTVERDNEDGATWEVEVTRTDGTTVDVRLSDNYEVIIVEGDDETDDHDDDSSE